jgi:hypothetical protein
VPRTGYSARRQSTTQGVAASAAAFAARSIYHSPIDHLHSTHHDRLFPDGTGRATSAHNKAARRRLEPSTSQGATMRTHRRTRTEYRTRPSSITSTRPTPSRASTPRSSNSKPSRTRPVKPDPWSPRAPPPRVGGLGRDCPSLTTRGAADTSRRWARSRARTRSEFPIAAASRQEEGGRQARGDDQRLARPSPRRDPRSARREPPRPRSHRRWRP